MAHVILVLRNHVQYVHARILAVTSCTIDAVIDMKSAQCTPAHSAEGLAPMVFIIVGVHIFDCTQATPTGGFGEDGYHYA
jgi:hypothetical protein